jgi:sulfur relay (sulfurtransferase) DsrF/TusC family protein
MKRPLLFVVSSDPTTSARPAEAIRIAAGLAVWEKIDVRICFWGASVIALDEDTQQFIDEENYTRYMPLLEKSGVAVYAQKDAPLLLRMGNPAIPYEEIAVDDLADLAAVSEFVARF